MNRRFDFCLLTQRGVVDCLYRWLSLEPLNGDDAFDREYVVHGDGEYVTDGVHVNTCESHRRAATCGSRLIEASPKTNSHPISGRSSFENASTNPLATKLSNPSSRLRYDTTNNLLCISVI